MNYELWNICNEMDTTAENAAATRDAFAFILDGLEHKACEVKDDPNAAFAFLSQYQNYSRMLYLLLTVMEDQGDKAKHLIKRAFGVLEKDQA